jgi:hypothetical protein
MSPKIKQDESLAGLLDYLSSGRECPRVYGPAIYFIPVKDGRLVDPKVGAVGIGLWVGGRKIRLFEFVEPPPAPGVEFIRQTEFIEGSEHGEEGDSETIRDDGTGPRPPRDQEDGVR